MHAWHSIPVSPLQQESVCEAGDESSRDRGSGAKDGLEHRRGQLGRHGTCNEIVLCCPDVRSHQHVHDSPVNWDTLLVDLFKNESQTALRSLRCSG